MKKVLLMSALVFSVSTILISCKKEENKTASLVEGTYFGSGTDSQGSPYVNLSVTVTEVDKKRISISCSNSNVFSTFETDIEYIDGAVTNSTTGEQPITVSFDTNEEPNSLGLSNGIMSFGGEKN